MDTLHRTRRSAFHRYRCGLPYLEDGYTTSRNRRFGYSQLPDTTLHCQSYSASNLYNPVLAVLACRHRGNPALYALSAQGKIFFDSFFFMGGYLT
ncbi:hypothetical protein FIU21_09145 [Prevotella melaninogenica]|uniref:Uncharacterized protein n=1 Tax=Prevotella melaninogenica TaxID=28132 RepID=A0A7D4KIJ1_9BACT|nr:hypothetical protein FIU21_09145 [Prevotella melaninogenica]